MSEWQPIETAPKDGTSILVLEDDGEFMFVAGWAEPAFAGETGYWASVACADGYYGSTTPTHWMPLPPPPQDR